MDVLFEDNHLLVVNKPVGLAVQGAAPGADSLVEQARAYLKAKHHKPGNVFVGVVSRLDAPVSGVVVLARTSKGAARLSEQFREATVGKTYWAVVAGSLPDKEGELCDWLAEDPQTPRMRVVDEGSPGAREARLRYRVLERAKGLSLVEVALITGRKHQIRVQLAAHGGAVLGDRKYGSKQTFPAGIALHARRLEIDHPTQRTRLTFVAPPPRAWRGLGLRLEG